MACATAGSGAQRLSFEHPLWIKKAGRGLPPGGNEFRTENVTTADDHVTLRCGASAASLSLPLAPAGLGYGTYEVTVDPPVWLDPNRGMAFAAFVYESDTREFELVESIRGKLQLGFQYPGKMTGMTDAVDAGRPLTLTARYSADGVDLQAVQDGVAIARSHQRAPAIPAPAAARFVLVCYRVREGVAEDRSVVFRDLMFTPGR
jgi:hypothetical protein